MVLNNVYAALVINFTHAFIKILLHVRASPLCYSMRDVKSRPLQPIVPASATSTLTHSWTRLYCGIFTPVLFVKVPEHAGTFSESIGTKYRVPEHHPLVFCKLLQYHYIRHGLAFHA